MRIDWLEGDWLKFKGLIKILVLNKNGIIVEYSLIIARFFINLEINKK